MILYHAALDVVLKPSLESDYSLGSKVVQHDCVRRLLAGPSRLLSCSAGGMDGIQLADAPVVEQVRFFHY